MAKTIHLPKIIREDKRIQKVFGDSKPVPKGYGSWQQIRMAWVMKQPQRVCENKNCMKPYFPQQASQRFCSQECHRNSKRKREPIPTTCKQCGRKSSYLQEGLCSFCRSKEAKFQREQRESQKNPTRKKIMFKCERCKSKVSKNVWQQNNGLCEECYSKRSVM